jgi:hypothetical protein
VSEAQSATSAIKPEKIKSLYARAKEIIQHGESRGIPSKVFKAGLKRLDYEAKIESLPAAERSRQRQR